MSTIVAFPVASKDQGEEVLDRLAGKVTDAAVFVLADDETAATIQEGVVAAGIAEVEVDSFPAEAEGVVKEYLELD